MDSFFSPAINVLNRFNFRGKFLLVNALVIVTLTGLAGILGTRLWSQVRATQQEQAGVSFLVPAFHAMQGIQKHRGLMVAILAGKTDLQKKADEVAVATDAALKDADTALNAAPVLSTTQAEWKSIRQEWAELLAKGPGMEAGANRIAHSKLVDHLLDHFENVVDASGLLLDTDPDGVYIIDSTFGRLPETLERMGRVRALGNQLLSKKTITDEDRDDLLSLVAGIQARTASVIKALKRAGAHRPELAAGVVRSESEVTPLLDWLAQTAHRDILTGTYATSPTEWYTKSTTAIDSLYTSVFDLFVPDLTHLLADREARLKQTFWFSILATTLVAAIVIYMLAAVSHAVVRAASTMAENAERVAAGDLTGRVHLMSQDELARIGNAFNRMSESVSALLRGARDTADHLIHSAEGLADASHKVASSSAGQSDSASTMAAAIEEMTVSVNHIADSAQDAQREASRAGELSLEGGKVVRQTIDDINQISASVQHSAKIIQELGNNSEEISAIVGTIKEIADQTNLLALNAAIEAARAGEQGRGFAVVADEVRKLAERTTQSTQEIAGMVTSIQQGVQQAVAAMEDGVSRVEAGVARAASAEKAIGQIREGTDHTIASVNQISDSLREQSAASTEIAQRVESIALMAEQNTVYSSETADTAGKLKDLALQLERNIDRFRI